MASDPSDPIIEKKIPNDFLSVPSKPQLGPMLKTFFIITYPQTLD